METRFWMLPDSAFKHKHKCSECGKRFLFPSHLRKHMADDHDVGVTWRCCTVEGCDYKAKQASHLKQHMAFVHDIGVTWHVCPVDGCDYKAKQAGNLKQHMADAHDVDVTWHVCTVESCRTAGVPLPGLR